jgi:S1-C subfamily serine protease
MGVRALTIGLIVLAVSGAHALAADAPAAPKVALTRVVTKLPAGSVWLRINPGFCWGDVGGSERFNGAPIEGDVEAFAPSFALAFPSEGHGQPSEQLSLFGGSRNTTAADFQAGALIHQLNVKVCGQPIVTDKLTADMSVQWQIFSTAAGKVVATIETKATTEFASNAHDVVELLRRSFADNAKQLAASPEMVRLLSGGQAAVDSAEGKLAPLLVKTGSHPRPIAESVGSVVLVSLGDSFGSGVLISSDGLILTNEHVVGKVKQVRVRWSDGFETTGEVLRTHPGRDVAVIKTDPRGREPLPIRVRAVQAGETVLAIGAPLDKELQGTVTRGVVSANRILDGFSFIQSDVMVNHGNSGGPLVDEKGEVVGLTDIGLQPNGAPAGLNFFVPIGDALDFLGLELAPTQAASAARAGATP